MQNERIITILIVIIAVCTKLSAQEIVTDRPDQTESSTTIPGKSLQIELGFGIGNNNNERLFLLPTALFRYGLTKRIELRYVEQVAGIENQLTSENIFGLTDMEVGAKFQIVKRENCNTEIAFISHVTIPTGSAELTTSNFGTVNKIAVSHGLNKSLDLGYNLGYNYFGTGNGDLTYTLAIGIGLSEKLGMYVETFGAYAELESWTSNLDTGITYLIRDNLQLDVSAGIGLNQKMNYMSVGCSWNIANFMKRN